ncbi:ComEC family competence protein [Chitinophaga silvatica]|uniref:ComEC family competence protein n=1 Tax=Chitinophaga silvatica TaxID=2282649 RepID=A0A3E1YDK1_9BACT|nr:ComEC/Rec2 family competence protein [Chitinophaga silvatica]RFS24084.1 ComEC family competence protein [Chitinophaga silvatica]
MQFEKIEPILTRWKRQPFLRIITPMVVGVIVGKAYSANIFFVYTLFFICILLLLYLQILPIFRAQFSSWLTGLLVYFLMFSNGYWITYKVDLRHSSSYFGHFLSPTSLCLVEISSFEEKKNTFRGLATIKAVFAPPEWKFTIGKIILYWPKTMNLQTGSRFITNLQPQLIKYSGNPGSFNYQEFAANQQLFYQASLYKSKIIALKSQSSYNWLNNATEYCVQQFRKYMGEGPEAGMAEALLIGYKQDLDKQVVSDYSTTGIVHIIAISGMHLALLYSSLLAILKVLPKRKLFMLLQAAIILSVLWAFALLTGASASVLRAVVMATMLVIGKFVIKQYSNSFNAFIASAFLLLSYDPYLLSDLGFQLSYLAVAGILIVYQPLYQSIKIKNKWIDLIWQSVAISLAAQLFTTPLSLFCFHQFPNYFLIANLITIPLSTIAIYGEIILLLTASFPLIPYWVGKGLWFLIHLMNVFVAWLAKLPGASVYNIHCNFIQAWLLYLLIAFLLLWRLKQWRPGLYWMLLCSWLIFLVKAYNIYYTRKQRILIVYNLPKQTAVDCIYGDMVNGFSDSDSSVLQATRSYYHATSGRSATIYRRHLSFCNKTIVIIDTLPIACSKHRWKADYLIVTNNTKASLYQLNRLYDFQTLIITAFNKRYMVEQWKKDCLHSNQTYYDMNEKGAFILNIK